MDSVYHLSGMVSTFILPNCEMVLPITRQQIYGPLLNTFLPYDIMLSICFIFKFKKEVQT